MEGLSREFVNPSGTKKAVDGLSLDIYEGQVLLSNPSVLLGCCMVHNHVVTHPGWMVNGLQHAGSVCTLFFGQLNENTTYCSVGVAEETYSLGQRQILMKQ
jgi:hypothetical protein